MRSTKSGLRSADSAMGVTGVRQDGFVEIRDGLRAGEQIVADGLNKIQPGQPVRILASQKGAEPGARAARPDA